MSTAKAKSFPSRFQTSPRPPHPKGSRARILLSSVYAPYAVDSEDSRAVTPMEFCHGQATRFQKAFSIRQFTHTYNLMLLQSNLLSPCTVLDFPTQERFIEELRTNDYDIVGIGAVGSNRLKVKRMCELIRAHKPNATIIVGGHIANTDHFLEDIDADCVVPGEGIRWLQEYLGEDTRAPIRHPITYANFDTRVMGVPIPARFNSRAAPVFPGVGCPEGCDFCLTSAKFGGKGRSISFYKTGDELFSIMEQIERTLGTGSFTILDENFLLYRKRALRLLELMEKHGKAWDIYTFSSAKAMERYTIDQLVALGLNLVWLSIEGKDSHFKKLKGIDTLAVVEKYHAHGIRIVGSAIIGLPEHTPGNIDEAIEYAVSHNADIMQFMLYMPAPGTDLFERMTKQELMTSLKVMPVEDWHGQYKFNYQHQHIPAGQETEFIHRAFRRDFAINGPSLLRMFETQLTGYQRYKNHPNERIRNRFAIATNTPWAIFASAMSWAAVKYFRAEKNERVARRLETFLARLHGEFGWKVFATTPLLGRVFYQALRREERGLARGVSHEPRCSKFQNRAALILKGESPASEVPWAVCASLANAGGAADVAPSPALSPAISTAVATDRALPDLVSAR